MTEHAQITLGARDRAALKDLSRPSDRRGLAHLAGHAALLAATGAAVLAAPGPLLLVPALVVHGIVLVFLFAPAHECVHRTAFRTRWINDAVARAVGVLLVLPAGDFRAFHTAHHRFTQVPGRDPELPGKEIAGVGGYLRHVSGLPYWAAAVTGLLRHAAGRVTEPHLKGRHGPRVVAEARAHLALYALLAAGSAWSGNAVLVWLWVVPAVLGQPFLRLYLLAEHKMLPLTADMLRNSRTTRSNGPVRFLAWNMPYHAAHHAFPAVPFHALPRAHARLAGRLDPATLSPGYLAFHGAYLRHLMRGEARVTA